METKKQRFLAALVLLVLGLGLAALMLVLLLARVI